MSGPLSNARHERFCVEYVVDHNGTRAAIRAGYSENSAAQQATRLLRNAQIVARVAELEDAVAKRAEVNADRILAGFADIAFVDIGDIVCWDEEGHVFLTPSRELSRSQRNAVKKVTHVRRTIPQKNAEPIVEETTALELESRKAALDSLAKILGMFKERVDINLVHSLAESMGLSPDEVMREAESILKGKVTS